MREWLSQRLISGRWAEASGWNTVTVMSRWHRRQRGTAAEQYCSFCREKRICSSRCSARGLTAAGFGRHLGFIYKLKKWTQSCLFNLKAGFLNTIFCPCNSNFKLLPCQFQLDPLKKITDLSHINWRNSHKLFLYLTRLIKWPSF